MPFLSFFFLLLAGALAPSYTSHHLSARATYKNIFFFLFWMRRQTEGEKTPNGEEEEEDGHPFPI
jgi:hypothetical protein